MSTKKSNARAERCRGKNSVLSLSVSDKEALRGLDLRLRESKRLIRLIDTLLLMASLWDIGKSTKEKLADEWESDGVLEEKVAQHREKFEDDFRENMEEDVPIHPYKIYRDIVESQELTDEERIALEFMKDEFSDRWQRLKQTHSN